MKSGLLLTTIVLFTVFAIDGFGVTNSRFFRHDEPFDAKGFRIRFSQSVLLAAYSGPFTVILGHEDAELPLEGREFYFTGGSAAQWDTLFLKWSTASSSDEIVLFEWLASDMSTVVLEEPITVMTYNIYEGGLLAYDVCEFAGIGADPLQRAAYLSCADAYLDSIERDGISDDLGGRLPWLVEAIQQSDADVVAIQEAWRWTNRGDMIVRKVAEILGMNYCFIPGYGDPTVMNIKLLVLLSRFEILEAEWEYEGVLNQDLLRAALLLPSGETLHVFNTHMVHGSAGGIQREHLAPVLEAYGDGYALLLGDMNTARESFTEFASKGWTHVAGITIDHVWVSPGFPLLKAEDVTVETFGTDSPALRGRRFGPMKGDRISDHDPILVTLWLTTTE